MRISDWSSDVCSSDLLRWKARTDWLASEASSQSKPAGSASRRHMAGCSAWARLSAATSCCTPAWRGSSSRCQSRLRDSDQDRKSGVWGKSVSVRVDLGGRRFIKKKKKNKKQKK